MKRPDKFDRMAFRRLKALGIWPCSNLCRVNQGCSTCDARVKDEAAALRRVDRAARRDERDRLLQDGKYTPDVRGLGDMGL